MALDAAAFRAANGTRGSGGEGGASSDMLGDDWLLSKDVERVPRKLRDKRAVR